MFVMPSMRLSLTRFAMDSTRRALFTMYGISVMTIWLLPFGRSTISVFARTLILPRPVA